MESFHYILFLSQNIRTRNFLIKFFLLFCRILKILLYMRTLFFNHLLATYGKPYKVTETVAVLHQMTLSAPRTHFFSLFCLDMQDNCITFVFLTGTFMGV